ncbi:carbohydrate ABC transporter permease [Lichenifustis flavocetrariae]|uniref:sn-glycerol-3-phosphate transport system permease protein UgpE n=1 Tax=Lichenifustis flavocetrariae TaxID=2949735 RepID=A0AA41YZS0_9HYPH|nr:carbohydrate ABC transporter permease [Lichenifustis flavocetrariae]MCW6511571.1 carbohydrate ABC transporter permease [Lichenifustis flavocetrariae]
MTLANEIILPSRAGWRPRFGLHRVLFHVAAVLVALLFLAPIAVVVLASFRPSSEAGLPPLPPWPTGGFSLDSYARLEAFGAGILHHAGNSLFVALGTAAITVVVSLLAGYGFSRFHFPLKGTLFVLILATMMIPFQSILTPLFLILARLGLQNTLTGLILIYVTLQLPFSVFMMRNAFDTVPKEIEEAARLDGATGLRLLAHIMSPIVFPGMVSVGLFAFLNAWNEFLAALVLLTDQDKFTLPVLMTAVRSGHYGSVDWGAVQAGVTVMMIPCLLLFLLLQRYYIRGLTAGSVK